MRLISLVAVSASLFFACKPKPDKTAIDLTSLRIVYNVYYDTLNDDYEIFSMNTDGTDRRNISNSKGVDWVYYAAGEKVYFISDRDTTHRTYFLYEMDALGNNVRKISDLRVEDSGISARKDGGEIVTAGRAGKKIRHQLYLINTEKGSYSPLTHDTTAYFNSPSFSPDGKQIVFRYRKNKRNFRTEKTELWMMNEDGSNMKQLTFYPETDTTAEWHAYHAGPPYWEPSQNVISFTSKQKGNYSIFVINPDGTELKQITDDMASEGWHTWSPDGQWVVYDGSDLNGEQYDIYLMKADGTEIRKLTDDWRTELAPVFALIKK